MKPFSHRYEVFFDTNGDWWAQVHCDCGTTITTSGKTPQEAIHEAATGFSEHLGSAVPTCGTSNHRAVRCFCEQCKRHGRELAIALDTLNGKRKATMSAAVARLNQHGGGDAPEPATAEHSAKIAAWPHMVIS